MRPIWSAFGPVNQRLPSKPSVMKAGALLAVGIGNSFTFPAAARTTLGTVAKAKVSRHRTKTKRRRVRAGLFKGDSFSSLGQSLTCVKSHISQKIYPFLLYMSILYLPNCGMWETGSLFNCKMVHLSLMPIPAAL